MEFLRRVYSLLRAMHDYVIVDTPPGFTPEVIASIDEASDICMVGTLDMLSLKSTKVGLETLGLMGYDLNRVNFVLNRADSRVKLSGEDVEAIIGRTTRRDRAEPSGHPALGERRRDDGALGAALGGRQGVHELAELYEQVAAPQRNGSRTARRRLRRNGRS